MTQIKRFEADNRATWLLVQDLQADPDNLRKWLHKAERSLEWRTKCLEEHPGRGAVLEISEALEEHYRTSMVAADDDLLGGGLYSELVDVAFSQIDWHGIALQLVLDVRDYNEEGGNPALRRLQATSFSLGTVCRTPGVMEKIPSGNVDLALFQHANGNWGDCTTEEWLANNRAAANASRIFSVYSVRGVGSFWIFTEADRSATIVTLPEER